MNSYAIPSFGLPTMADFNLLPVANKHMNTARSEPPTTPKIKPNLFEDLFICLLSLGGVIATGVLTGAGALTGGGAKGGGAKGGGAAVELKKLYIS